MFASFHSKMKLNGTKLSGEKFGVLRVVVFFSGNSGNVVSFVTGNCRKCKPEFFCDMESTQYLNTQSTIKMLLTSS